MWACLKYKSVNQKINSIDLNHRIQKEKKKKLNGNGN